MKFIDNWLQHLWHAWSIRLAALAGIVAASQVIEKLARAYADDGQVTREELAEIFGGSKGE